MTELTIVPHTEPACPERSNDLPHCWHATGNPIQGPNWVTFENVCCFCAPTYMKQDVILPWNMDQTTVVAEQMKHGRLVVMRRQDKPKQQIAVAKSAPRH